MKLDVLYSHADAVLSHLYITPLEKCNLCCKICYTAKTSDILTPEAILNFVTRYQAVHELKMVTFCGGEVMLLRTFPEIVNKITSQGIFVQIITNGTADRLAEFDTPNSINLIVSLDGVQAYHDKNRGIGNFAKSMAFLKKAQGLGYHIEIFSIATTENIREIPTFEEYLAGELGELPEITYHPRKNLDYLSAHPISNQNKDAEEGFGFPSLQDIKKLSQAKTVFPPPSLGCYQLSLMSNGNVNACCEGIRPLGNLDTPIDEIIKNFHKRIDDWHNKFPDNPTLGCVEPDFLCGLKVS